MIPRITASEVRNVLSLRAPRLRSATAVMPSRTLSRSCTCSGLPASASWTILPSTSTSTRSATDGRAGVVGDHHHGLAELVDRPPQQRQHLLAGPGVQVAGRLVGEHHGGLGHQRPRNRHALLLAAGQLGRPVRQAVAEVDRAHELVEQLGVAVAPGDRQRQADVLLRAQHRQQVEELEDEADLVAPQLGQALVVEVGDLLAGDPDRALGGPVEPGQHVHQGGLARARRAHDGREAALGEVDRDAVEGVDGGVALTEAAVHVDGAHDGLRIGCHGRHFRMGPAAPSGCP